MYSSRDEILFIYLLKRFYVGKFLETGSNIISYEKDIDTFYLFSSRLSQSTR